MAATQMINNNNTVDDDAAANEQLHTRMNIGVRPPRARRFLKEHCKKMRVGDEGGAAFATFLDALTGYICEELLRHAANSKRITIQSKDIGAMMRDKDFPLLPMLPRVFVHGGGIAPLTDRHLKNPLLVSERTRRKRKRRAQADAAEAAAEDAPVPAPAPVPLSAAAAAALADDDSDEGSVAERAVARRRKKKRARVSVSSRLDEVDEDDDDDERDNEDESRASASSRKKRRQK